MTKAGGGATAAPDIPIPADWGEVTPQWLTAAISASHPGVRVDDVEVLLVDDGTNRRSRIGVTYADGDGPSTFFLKASDPDHAEISARSGGLLGEPQLFRSGVDLPIEHPAVHCALVDEPALSYVMVMEDVVGNGGDPRDATRPLTPEQAADGVAGLARLHARFWGRRLAEAPGLGFVEPFAAWFDMARGIDAGTERLGDLVPAAVSGLGGEAIDATWRRYVAGVAGGPTTLIHGDAHIGNTYTRPGDRLGFLDWQVVHSGDHCLDLGYFLQGALTVEDRRTHEDALVEHYLDSLALPDDEVPDRNDVWLRYRASAAHGLTLWLATAASNWQRPEVSAALSERYAVAFCDLETAAAAAALQSGIETGGAKK